jgi:cell division protein FtsQ
MLSENGDLFPAPKGVGSSLPLFEGPDSRASELMAFHSMAKPMFMSSGLRVAIVRLSARGSWNLTLSDGCEIEVGRGDPQLRLARFARLLPRIDGADPREIKRADLRYTNGFALTWRDLVVASPPVPATQAKS